ncbi:Hypothetical protein NCS54_01257100 [Fusarium falciforme]|uniref:Uncharacterized protein n=1 Tax=Fusarium falciforme TaxID=195108 RepID=A0A9W8RCE5_9HYPO|nr:Hypothetical protein NCS54_01257100 [Fusarium falciforme]KAI8655891.1 hypothetical protein NCS55_01242500 [Fusarium keratoplasticum]KAJ4193293.1 hypothetical protein NW755_003290 [Fusarium falciforme]KAJ4193726.1 hypothetical protein NW767_010250 [Fusarium falciforme]WAO94964.1 Hypothetical protein NCS54_01257100 [Fusarium falciforme]
MSVMPTESEMRSRRDSWPPTQVRLKPTVSTKDDPLPSLDDIDDDPLTYFLTPAPNMDDDDLDQVMMDFDAGIEDASQPRPIVRSVSPSTLDGLRKPGLRPISPDTSSDISTSNNEDEDDDDEEYISFSPSKHGLLSLQDIFANSRPPVRPKSPAFNQSSNTTLLSPASFSNSQLRGRARGRGRHGASSRNLTARRRAAAGGQLWREPSPDVWSIEEETEEEMMSDMGSSVAAPSDVGDDEVEGEGKRAMKPKKKVRFMLPAREGQ